MSPKKGLVSLPTVTSFVKQNPPQDKNATVFDKWIVGVQAQFIRVSGRTSETVERPVQIPPSSFMASYIAK